MQKGTYWTQRFSAESLEEESMSLELQKCEPEN